MPRPGEPLGGGAGRVQRGSDELPLPFQILLAERRDPATRPRKAGFGEETMKRSPVPGPEIGGARPRSEAGSVSPGELRGLVVDQPPQAPGVGSLEPEPVEEP